MHVNRMTGTPWHIERVHRAEGDERRYKGRCKFYEYEQDRCAHSGRKCSGSAHCTKYRAISEEEFVKRQHEMQEQQNKKQQRKRLQTKKKIEEEKVYWYR